jgi:hypothetical protein
MARLVRVSPVNVAQHGIQRGNSGMTYFSDLDLAALRNIQKSVS